MSPIFDHSQTFELFSVECYPVLFAFVKEFDECVFQLFCWLTSGQHIVHWFLQSWNSIGHKVCRETEPIPCGRQANGPREVAELSPQRYEAREERWFFRQGYLVVPRKHVDWGNPLLSGVHSGNDIFSWAEWPNRSLYDLIGKAQIWGQSFVLLLSKGELKWSEVKWSELAQIVEI